MFQIIEVVSTWGIGFVAPIIATGLFMINLEMKKEANKNL
jgi:hypothetical protein